MVQAITSSAIIGGSSAANPGNAASALASLQAQLARYQQQLSDCVNCASSKTIEGKVQIQSVSSKISQVRARIDQVNSVNASQQTPLPKTSRSKENNSITKDLTIAPAIENRTVTPPSLSIANPVIGGNINTLA
ncbi:hypothetical protein AAKU64_001353 [Undibacterium sp. GrIS 1.8]|uniref:FlxA-like family protein n=1 Tax=unclassified Undibacterium TaxID=2630295 RepID=UPI0033920CE5